MIQNCKCVLEITQTDIETFSLQFWHREQTYLLKYSCIIHQSGCSLPVTVFKARCVTPLLLLQVCPSVCLSVTLVYHVTVQDTNIRFSPYSTKTMIIPVSCD